MLFLLAGIMGAMLLPLINLQLNPSPRVQKLSVDFSYPNTGPVEVERQVTSLLERVLSRLEHLTEITSISEENRGSISMSFSREADMADVRLNASVLIRQTYAQLPREVTYPQISYDSKFETKSSLLSYAVISDLPGKELEELLRQKLVSPLGLIDGVSDITLRGLQKDECQITYDANQLAKLNINARVISTAIRQDNERHFVGTIYNGKDHSVAVNIARQQSQENEIQHLRNLPIATSGGRNIRLGELASIDIVPSMVQTYYRINKQRSTNMTLYADEDVNFIKLASICRKKIAELKNSIPKGVDLLLEMDRSAYLAKELRTIGIRMLAAMLILFFSMVIIYRHWFKIFAVWSGFTISLLVSVIIYYLAGLELHLYSLAGMTLSLGIVLDNLIVATDHIYKDRSQKIFVALLAATLTTIGALSIIFFISPEYREQLTDFAWVFIINVLVSLLVSLYYLPAIITEQDSSVISWSRRRRLVKFNRLYSAYSRRIARRWILLTLLILAFGIPLFLLPNEIKSERKIARIYNEVMVGWYGEKLHTKLSRYLGGTLRLFTKRKDNFYFAQTEKQETRLFLRASVPFGGTTEQLNHIIKDFEEYISSFSEVKQVSSFVSGPNTSSVEISFRPEYADGAFPYYLKSLLETRAVNSGGGDFQIYGVGQGFNNELRGRRLTTHLRLLGYNYDQLQEVAMEARKNLLQHMRIQNVSINPTRNYFDSDDRYFDLSFDEKLMNNLRPQRRGTYLEYWRDITPDKGTIGILQTDQNPLPIRVISNDPQSNDIWVAQHTLQANDTAEYLKTHTVNSLEVHHGENKIVRYNQQYQLFLEYDFVGNYRLAEKIKKQALQEIKAQLPPGYQISDDQRGWWWSDSQDKVVYIVLASILVIFIISSILFNSLRQALVPILLVPVSFIGIFLAVHFFNFRFDQGGFAAFLLVAGLSVNAGIFIINDYNNIRKHRNLSSFQAFVKAYNAKIIPILLTIFSTVLGLLPFLLFEKNEPFWYSLAICTIAGLVFSVIGVVVFLELGIVSRQLRKNN